MIIQYKRLALALLLCFIIGLLFVTSITRAQFTQVHHTAEKRLAFTPCNTTDGWITYGHDARRSFASSACINGPLTTLWQYTPPPPTIISGPDPGRQCTWTVTNAYNVIATGSEVYFLYGANGAQCQVAGAISTAVNKLTSGGNYLWTYNWRTDANEGYWPTLALNQLIIQNDNIHGVDPATGKPLWGNLFDRWGQTAPDVDRVYAVNTLHADGPGINLQASNSSGSVLWQKNNLSKCKGDAADSNGGLAIDNGVAFFAPNYQFTVTPAPFKSGIYAFTTKNGSKKWFVLTTPTSAVSAGAGNLYLIENSNTLVARSEATGSIIWSQNVTGAGTQAPVLDGSHVIVATSGTIQAFDQATGKSVWSSPTPNAAVFTEQYGQVTNTKCGTGSVNAIKNVKTTMAAALGTNTLVVTAGNTLHILSLSDGSDLWSGTIPNAIGNLHDPVLVGNTVYVVDSGLNLFAMK